LISVHPNCGSAASARLPVSKNTQSSVRSSTARIASSRNPENTFSRPSFPKNRLCAAISSAPRLSANFFTCSGFSVLCSRTMMSGYARTKSSADVVPGFV
jgi:hypothetical protein